MLIEYYEGMEVRTNSMLTESKLHIFKPHPWVEYEEKDHWWIVKYGFGKWITVPSMRCYMVEVPASDVEALMLGMGAYGVPNARKPRMKQVIVMHPDTWDRVKKELAELKRSRDRMFELPHFYEPPFMMGAV